MRDSRKDHWAAVGVLTAFIRSQSTSTTEAGLAAVDSQPDFGVVAAVTVLARRPRRRDLELDRLRLGGADLRSTLLRRGRLDRAAMRGAHLEDIHWEHASLVEAQLDNAFMMKADLVGVNLSKASLVGADLTGADLRNTDFDEATVSGAHFANTAALLSSDQLAAVHCRPDKEACPRSARRDEVTDDANFP